MGASCGSKIITDNTQSPTALKCAAEAKSKFAFLLNDKDILFSPKSPSIATSTKSASKSAKTPTKFKYPKPGTNTSAKPLSIPTYQLRNTTSLDMNMEDGKDEMQDDKTVIIYSPTIYESESLSPRVTSTPTPTPMTVADSQRITQIDNTVHLTPKSGVATVTPKQVTRSQTLLSKSKPNLYRPNTTASWDFSDIEDLEDEMKREIRSLSQINIVPAAVHNKSLLTPGSRTIKSASCTALDNFVKRNQLDGDADGDSDFDSSSSDDDDGNGNDMMSYNDYNYLFENIGDLGDVEAVIRRASSLYVEHIKTDTITSFAFIESKDGNDADGHMIPERGTNLVQTEECDWDSEDMDLEEDQMKKHLNHLKNEHSNSIDSNCSNHSNSGRSY